MNYKITKVNAHIFRAYDIRGIMGDDLNDDVYYTIGRAYGTFLLKRRIDEAAVGRDNRLNGENYSKAFIAGLNDSGVNTYELGYSLSQIVYFSSYFFQTKGGAMVTASHNPKEFNGLKLSVGYSDTMVTDEVQELKSIVDSQKFSDGNGVNKQQDIYPEYRADILKHFDMKKKWKVVVDACNSTSGLFYPDLLRTAGCEVIEMNTKLDSNFPLGHPDPTESHVLERVAKRVLEEKAELGFAYDSDGDRMAVVDNLGRVLWMDSIVALYAQDILDFLPGSKIVSNALCSRQVKETIEKHGGESIVWKVGHSFIKSKVKEERAPFGGEMSGHIFFMDNFYGHDDGAFATMRLLSYLERTDQSLAEAFDKLPKYISSPEIKIGLADDKKFQYIDTDVTEFFKKEFAGSEFNSIDGIRYDDNDSMAIIRASQNGPYITIKFEANTQEKYDLLKKKLGDFLHKNVEIDFESGSNTHALD